MMERFQTDNLTLLRDPWTNASNISDTANATYGGDEDSFYRHSPALTAIYCLAYLSVFVLGLIGNCLVVAVVIRAPRMRTVTNLFIVNLAIADVLVVIFCLPATLLSNIFVPWLLGPLMCKLFPYVQGVSVVASVDSLVAVSVDRVLAICFPMRFQITGRRARLIILLIWVVALTTTIPWPMYFHLTSGEEAVESESDFLYCVEEWPSGEYQQTVYFVVVNVIFCYLLPLLLILICYSMIWIKVWSRSIPTESCGKDDHLERIQQRSKVKVVKMLVVVVIIFMLSWLPLYAIFIRIKLGSKDIEPWEDGLLAYATPIAQWLGAFNSCINPILYAYFNQKFRRGFTAIIKSRSCCGAIRTTAEYNSTYNEATIQLRMRRNLSVNPSLAINGQSTRRLTQRQQEQTDEDTNVTAPLQPTATSGDLQEIQIDPACAVKQWRTSVHNV